MSSPLAPEVARFIAEKIDSVEQLEILLLLRTDPSRAWTAVALAAEMRTSEGSALLRLEALAHHGLATRRLGSPAEFQYDPSEDATVAAVATAYLTRRFAVIDGIIDHQRSGTDKIRLFADAFRIRGKRDDEDG